jgi:EmrB/QacA subfamily drug resistance transporter
VSDVQPSFASRRELRVVLPALMVAILLAMLDSMIVATALPRIVGELGGLSHLSWVVTAYTLGLSVSTPLWGKLGDLYGRKGSFLTSIVIFLVGSALSGAAAGMTELIAFRGLQGIGAGGLMVGVMAIIGDLVAPRERGRIQGMFAGIMAVAMVGGPLAGGLITDHLSWRWAFYINLPIGAAALVLVTTRLQLPTRRSAHRIDWLGAALLSVGITALTLITTWGGSQYDWASGEIVGLAVLAAGTLAAFFVVERRVPEPVLPLTIFANRNFALISAIGFLLGAAMFGAINFLPLYQQTVQGASATNSGLLLLPMMGGLLLTSLLAGQLVSRTGRYRVIPIAGGIMVTAGTLLLTRLDAGTTRPASALSMFVLGAGMGCLMQITLLIAENSVHPRDMGVASSTATFMRSIGGSFGVALFGAVFTHQLRTDVAARLGARAAEQVDQAGGNLDPAVLASLPAPVQDGFQHAIAQATAGMFWWAVPIALAVAVLTWFIVEHPLRGFADQPPAADEPAGAAAPVPAG